MQQVTSIGGFFFRSQDLSALAQWYEDYDPEGNPIELWEPKVNPWK